MPVWYELTGAVDFFPIGPGASSAAAGEVGAVTSSGGEAAGVGAEGGGVEADGGFSKFPLTFSTPTVAWISAIALRFASTVPIK